MSPDHILNSIEAYIEHIIDQLTSHDSVSMPTGKHKKGLHIFQSAQNCRSAGNSGPMLTLAITLHILCQCYQNVLEHTQCTKR
jgi:hypothetical protein